MDISIITPTYNLAPYIRKTYDSLKNQDYRSWEWIIADDGSTDGTQKIIQSFDDSRLILLQFNHSGNLSFLRNEAFKVTKGSIIAFLDGDDLYRSDALTHVNNFFNSNRDVDFIHTDVLLHYEDSGKRICSNKKDKLANVTSNSAYLSRILKSNVITISSVFIRRSAFKGVGLFNEKFSFCEDIELWLRLLAQGFTIGFIKEPLIEYLIRDSGLYNSRRLNYLRTNFRVYSEFIVKYPWLFLSNIKAIFGFYSNNYEQMFHWFTSKGQKKYHLKLLSLMFNPTKMMRSR